MWLTVCTALKANRSTVFLRPYLQPKLRPKLRPYLDSSWIQVGISHHLSRDPGLVFFDLPYLPRHNSWKSRNGPWRRLIEFDTWSGTPFLCSLYSTPTCIPLLPTQLLCKLAIWSHQIYLMMIMRGLASSYNVCLLKATIKGHRASPAARGHFAKCHFIHTHPIPWIIF